jgi:hypothetical protein
MLMVEDENRKRAEWFHKDSVRKICMNIATYSIRGWVRSKVHIINQEELISSCITRLLQFSLLRSKIAGFLQSYWD